MADELIWDRGNGPEIAGTRVSVYTLLPYLLDPTVTEAVISDIYELTPEQIAAARAYVLNNAEPVLTRHLEIEERMAAGNPPEVAERARQTRAKFLTFKEWLLNRQQAEALETAYGRPGDRPKRPGSFDIPRMAQGPRGTSGEEDVRCAAC